MNDYPNNHWSYIAFGDAYMMMDKNKSKNYIKAKECYEKALIVVKDEMDKFTIIERLEDL